MTAYQSQIDRISKATTLDEIREIAAELSAKAAREGGITYSGKVGEVSSRVIALEITSKTDLPIIDGTPRGQFLLNKNVEYEIKDAATRILESGGMPSDEASRNAAHFLFGDDKAPVRSQTSIERSLWGEASREFSGSLRGRVTAVIAQANPERVLGRVELQESLNGGRVTFVNEQPVEALRAKFAQEGARGVLPELQDGFMDAARRGVFSLPDNLGKQITQVSISRETATALGVDPSRFIGTQALSEAGFVRAPIGVDALARPVNKAALAIEAVPASRGLTPRVVRGVQVVGAAASVIDLGLTARDAKVLMDQGNTVGAQSQVLRFGARNVGGWTGALVGAQAGAALGVESGPGMVLTGIAGAGIGAWGANKAVDWIEQQRINQQTDRNGMSWSFDPKQPEKGWTREVMDAFVERGPSIKHTETAPAAVSGELNYKASSKAVQLRLATPDVPVDPYRIAADASDTRSLRESPWTRNPQTQQWTREVADGLIDRTMHTYTETADPKKAVELDTYAQSVIAYNAARTPAAIAGHYEGTYAQADWKQYGLVPDAVAQARAKTDALQASDGKLYIRGKDGEWTHDGVLSNTRAEGNVRTELDATQQQVQGMLSPQPGAISGPRMRGPGNKTTDEKPSLDLERRAPGDTLSANPAADQAMPVIPNPIQTRGPRDPRDPDDPDHAMNQSVREQVKALYAEHGISLSDQQLEQTTASVMKDARHSQMDKVTLLQFSQDYTTGRPDLNGNLLAWQGDPSQPWSKMSSTNTQQAAQTQPEVAYQQFAQDTQQQAQVQARFLEQQRQLNDPTQQGPTMQR